MASTEASYRAPTRAFRLTLLTCAPRCSRSPAAAGDMLSLMEKPKEDSDQSPEDDAEEAAKQAAADVDSYESEWYEVLKRRAEELEEAGEAAKDDEA